MNTRVRDLAAAAAAATLATAAWTAERAIDKEVVVNATPVSYTHLDVYKRQVQ